MQGTALITGGAGFIGSHLAERLLREGARVIVADDLSTGSRRNVEHLLSDPAFELIEMDVTADGRLDGLVGDAHIVYHLAAAVGVRLIVERPLSTMLTNIRGTEEVLRHAVRHGTPVLLASTSEVYGRSTRLPFAEGDDLLIGPSDNPRWSYSCAKAADEFLALACHRERGLPVTIVRFFNIVGPRQTGRYGMVIPTFVRQALAGEPLTVFGDGSQRRCFTHVDRAVEALCRLSEEPAANGVVFNVGDDEEISILALAELVRARTGSRAPIRFVPHGAAYGVESFADVTRRVPDTTRITPLMSGCARLDIEAIVDSVVEHCRRHPEPT